MSDNDQYFADFMTVFSSLERWGPGADSDSLKALKLVPFTPQNIIDIGCGKGFSTSLLAQQTSANIVAVDSEQSALDSLALRLKQNNLDKRVTLNCADMASLDYPPASFDLIWAESSAYSIGVEQALKAWKPLLSAQGCLVVSDLVWLTDKPSDDAKAFWQKEYADMQKVSTRLTQMEQAGFKVLNHFSLSHQAWEDYYQPLKARINDLKPSMPESKALVDLMREVEFYEQYFGEFGYEMFVLQN